MSSHVAPGQSSQDRTISDLLESYRHRQSDPTVSDDRKQRATERMKPVWADLAKLQDPSGFVNHISEVVQREHHRRHNSEDPTVTRRTKPLCRCDLPRHVCEAKQGEVPSKIRSQTLDYIEKPDSQALAREYLQEHSGDVVIREAVDGYRGLRSDIYAELSEILAMMMGAEPIREGDTDADRAGEDESGPSDGENTNGADAATVDDDDDSAELRAVNGDRSG